MGYKSEAAKKADEKMRQKRFRHTLFINPSTEPELFKIATELDESKQLNKTLKDAILAKGLEIKGELR